MHAKIGNQHTVITPDKLYGKYISTAAGLSVDATKWSITLCCSYFNYLVTSIQDKMEDDDFNMPPLNCQATKTLQLGDLRLVRAAAASAYKSLVDEEQRLRRVFLIKLV